MKTISIITPVYNEEETLQVCYEAITKCFAKDLSQYNLEYIFCDNASTDTTPELLKKLAQQDKRVKVIFNSRNFGPLRSTYNGLLSATGDGIVVLFPVDLQDPVEVIPRFVKEWEEGFEVVYGQRANRHEGFFGKRLKKLYYYILSKFSDITIPQNTASFQFIDKKVLEALKKHEDYYPHIPNLIANCGFKRKSIQYNWAPRTKGTRKNNFYSVFDEALNSLISFSKAPMRICLFLGLIMSIGSILFAAFTFASVMYLKMQGDTAAAPGISTLITALFFLSGIQFFILGVFGEYIAAIHSQVRKRPLVIERQRLNYDTNNNT